MDHYFVKKSIGMNKRERTRSALIDGAIQVIARKGFETASIKEIAEVSGLANGTFYNHFADRDALAREAAVVVAIEIAHEIAVEVEGVTIALDKMILSTDKMVSRAVSAPEWGKILVGAWHYLDDFHLDIAQFMRKDMKLAQRQGLISVPINSFLEYQQTALVIASIAHQLRHGCNKSVRISTCEASLRLIGIDPVEARALVLKVLGI
jgi:AcrR family transcriptional regulator